MNKENNELQSLGHSTPVPEKYMPEILETFENQHQDRDYWVQFNCDEFTTLCPITGQPDFAKIKILYIPDKRMVESKSLKLYLFSFRNQGNFHEDCINLIINDLIKSLQPRYIEVIGLFVPRGGISIYPYVNYGKPETGYEKLAQERMSHHSCLSL
ncbi:MAG: NADPH-dependent 7-cyano-7-deazaguanine reductase QueF [Bacteroidales bacterium]|nr:NADPH-dependent 7-cyano-7-deazaguanine reductase QueF [Bacteroidales bacterium]